MHRHHATPRGAFGAPAALAVLLLLAAPAGEAMAGNLLGAYVGAAIGQSRVDTSSGGLVPSPTDHFRENHSAFKFVAGVRPISLLGAELEYVDFGHPSGSLGAAPANVAMTGVAAFAILYLPVPVVDLYVKAGAARLQSTLNGIANPSCTPCFAGSLQPTAPFHIDRANTSAAAGAGVQFKLGPLAVQAEYERFTTVGGHPDLVTLGLTWTF